MAIKSPVFHNHHEYIEYIKQYTNSYYSERQIKIREEKRDGPDYYPCIVFFDVSSNYYNERNILEEEFVYLKDFLQESKNTVALVRVIQPIEFLKEDSVTMAEIYMCYESNPHMTNDFYDVNKLMTEVGDKLECHLAVHGD